MLVLGIVSLVFTCAYGIGLIAAIVALVLAPGGKREIAASQGRLTGEGMIKAGVICSWITVGLAVLGVILLVIVLIVAASTSSSTSVNYGPAIQGALVWFGR